MPIEPNPYGRTTQWQRMLSSWDVGDLLLSVSECIVVQKGSILIGGAAD